MCVIYQQSFPLLDVGKKKVKEKKMVKEITTEITTAG